MGMIRVFLKRLVFLMKMVNNNSVFLLFIPGTRFVGLCLFYFVVPEGQKVWRFRYLKADLFSHNPLVVLSVSKYIFLVNSKTTIVII